MSVPVVLTIPFLKLSRASSFFVFGSFFIKSSKNLSIAQATALTEKMALVFSEIEDPRVERTRVHVLTDILIRRLRTR